jgi:hypothetical protein
MRIISIPTVASLPNLNPPHRGNTGGFSLGNVHIYSPIDISVAMITSIIENKPLTFTDLSKWFIINEIRVGEVWVNCTASIEKQIMNLSISQWKVLSLKNEEILSVFKRIAPFTFR